MATTSALYRTPRSTRTNFPSFVDKVDALVDATDRVVTQTFGHEFIERRLRQHREMQEQLAAEGAKENHPRSCGRPRNLC